MYEKIIHRKGYLRSVLMNNEATRTSNKCLETSVDQLTVENQLYFLGILEALTFAQNMTERKIEPEVISNK
jgi:hypothetical protein